eukprot:m.45040 g.45040  ORF g.45040 m.45040 type:complete len:332 (+) comp7199_c0_seq1:456-1451(+)
MFPTTPHQHMVHDEEKERLTICMKDLQPRVDGRFECNVCHTSFKHRAHLKRHMICHTEAPTHVCQFIDKNGTTCRRGFYRKDHYRYHMSQHNKTKSFKCLHPGCSSAFRQKGALTRHVSHVHRKVTCTTCSQDFSTKSKLQAHLVASHTLPQPLKHPSVVAVAFPPSSSSTPLPSPLSSQPITREYEPDHHFGPTSSLADTTMDNSCISFSPASTFSKHIHVQEHDNEHPLQNVKYTPHSTSNSNNFKLSQLEQKGVDSSLRVTGGDVVDTLLSILSLDPTMCANVLLQLQANANVVDMINDAIKDKISSYQQRMTSCFRPATSTNSLQTE